MATPECNGVCEECISPESCLNDPNICKQHTGTTARISALMERVGDLEDKDSQVDNLTGRVNILINICLIMVAAIIGDFGYSITVNKLFEAKYQVDQLALKDTLANDRLALSNSFYTMSNDFKIKIDNLSTSMEKEIKLMSKSVNDKVDSLAKETDVRFDKLEREFPLIEREVRNLRDSHVQEIEKLKGK